jgi:predicted lipid-binding transport protein (Tim44 family)
MAVVLAVGMASSFEAEAKRLGGGKSSGMQRNNVTQPANSPNTPQNTPNAPTQAAPATAGAAAAAPAAAAGKRSWMGPIAGIAAGLGIAALASHFGFGEALANMLTIALLVMAVLMVVGFILRKRAQQGGGLAAAHGAAGAGATGGPVRLGGMQRSSVGQGGSLIGSALGTAGGAGASTVRSFPAGFDAAAFERNAKDQFMALQAANDAGDLQRLQDFLTPELVEAAREEIAERGGAQQRTEVYGLVAQVLDVTAEDTRYVASVRFTGSIRTQPGVAPDALDEVWHLTKPREGLGGWLVAGIQQLDADGQGGAAQ